MHRDAQAYWLREPAVGEIRNVKIPAPSRGEVLVRTVHTAISRGTESVVHLGRVPRDQYTSMRAPFQDGDFPAPVKYGYLNVGVVEEGPAPLQGRTVFCLYPHQTHYVVPASDVVVVPEGVPADRAVLAGTVETAVNAMWDAAPLLGCRATIVGAGMVGCCVARLMRGIPGAQVTLVDTDDSRRRTARELGIDFAPPDAAEGCRDLVVHTSATSEGLQTSLDLLATDGTVIDLSWYGDRAVSLSLGSAFHSRRLTVRSSQVGTVSPAVMGRRTFRERMSLALELLRDPAFDALITGHSPFHDLPTAMQSIATGELNAICHVIDYGGADVQRHGA